MWIIIRLQKTYSISVQKPNSPACIQQNYRVTSSTFLILAAYNRQNGCITMLLHSTIGFGCRQPGTVAVFKLAETAVIYNHIKGLILAADGPTFLIAGKCQSRGRGGGAGVGNRLLCISSVNLFHLYLLSS